MPTFNALAALLRGSIYTRLNYKFLFLLIALSGTDIACKVKALITLEILVPTRSQNDTFLNQFHQTIRRNLDR